MRPFGEARLLHKYTVCYFQCPACGFTCTETPYWLDEAYGDAIAASDVGLVSRNLMLARVTKAVILLCLREGGPFLDYGAGYGLLVRLMRDKGFDFAWHDAHAANLFAGVAPGDSSGRTRYSLITAFELFEHLPDPAAELERMLRCSDSVLLSTLLLPTHNPRPGEWWYYSLDHGQHVSLYTRRSLGLLGARFGMRLLSDGRHIHLLTRRPITRAARAKAARPRLAALVDLALRRPSLIDADYRRVAGRPPQ
jgi:2-polyprenyl-3-methyl-5-hydroxy-6-metoxy-1,4-benzoquinol methylase